MELAFLVLAALSAIVGIVVGIQLSLWVQAALVGAIIVALNSWMVRKYGLGAFPIMTVGVLFIIGMCIGDAVYVYQVKNVTVTFAWFFDLFKATTK